MNARLVGPVGFAVAAPVPACPVYPICSACGGVAGRCPWLAMVEARRSRLRGWLVAGAGTLAVAAACAGLVLLYPPRPAPMMVVPVMLSPEAVPRALDVSALADPAPAIPDGAPQAPSEVPPETALDLAAPPPEAAAPAPARASLPAPAPPALDLPALDTAPPTAPPPAPPEEVVPETVPPETVLPEVAVPDTRPRPRPQRVERQAAEPPPPQPAPAPSPAPSAAPAGQQGSAGANSARQQGSPAAAQVSAGEWTTRVIAKIRSVRQKRVRGSGTVTIGFSVTPGGALASVSVLRSSGNPDLDRTGLDHIRRAAPFPPPPPGAGQGLSFDFTAR